MTNLIVELSKYLLMILMVGYVFFQYFYYRKKTDAGRRHMVGMQNFFLFCVHFLGYLILFLKTEDSKIPVSYTHLDVYKRQSLRWLHRQMRKS